MKTQKTHIMEKFNYYRSELENIDTKNQYAPTVQIKDANGNKTKNMDINEESAKELVVWLQNNFILKK